uniref:Uncharacterized protein n=1 Tax=Hyaloperonospora arabidopsidis (strain Emoy2) TaxID=559515 RepID=M4BEM9_HYAAE
MESIESQFHAVLACDTSSGEGVVRTVRISDEVCNPSAFRVQGYEFFFNLCRPEGVIKCR